ncbi:type II toxin-antitoxin system VapC family toxin [Actinopolyspora halophila]|uniref:type II toxin-antitoxin system VapC family toxin n=1 Tax=Actinopolyspora halophila TaxID=1850 RepID=UPI00036FDEC6|nr:type II toxin-antitoxin system VapC family toxin [Actinopolyspora halophila]
MIILDTNVVSELVRARPERSVLEWSDSLVVDEVAITAATVAELLHGVTRLPDGQRKAALGEAVRSVVDDDFHDRVESFDSIAATHYGDVLIGRERRGRPITVANAQIAAICRARGTTLATRSTKDFEGAGIELVDPWNSEQPTQSP